MSPVRDCDLCHEPFMRNVRECPHCGRPSLFPNVEDSEQLSQTAALQNRYDQATTDAKTRTCHSEVMAFQTAAAGSEAVINRYFGEVYRLAHSDDEIYATFYQRIEGGMRLPEGGKWDRLRAMADTALFGDVNKREIRFGALTLDGFGVSHYGECSMLLKTNMIEHRASIFEENTVIFMRDHNLQASNDYAIPEGYQSSWGSRGIIAAAKMAKDISAATTPNEFPQLLLQDGPDNESDRFVEVHIWGTLTIRSVKSIAVRAFTVPPSTEELKVLENKLVQFKVAFKMP